jgi:phosphate transport system substrate-binding protein
MRGNWMVRGILAAGAVLAGAVAMAGEVKFGGAGASFPAPLYKYWVAQFQKANPDIRIDYQGIGSGGGIKAITDKTVAFGATDAPLNRKELEALGGAEKVLQVPMVIGGVVPAYNLPGVTKELRFTGELLAEMFIGGVNSWDDPRIKELNPGVELPKLAITPVWRTDGSGTTFVFTSYLATQNPAFREAVGTGKQVRWPIGQGGKSNEGVAAVIQQTAGALGYIEQNYAVANKIAYGAVRNANNEFVKATPESMSLAAEPAAKLLKGTVLSADIWNQPGAGVYPISSFTYIVLHRDLNNLASIEEARALAKFLHWATSEGQTMAVSLEYAPLSPSAAEKVHAALDQLTFKGEAVR